MNKTDRFLRSLKRQPEQVTPMGMQGMILPNHSGDHSAGLVLNTPNKDIDIVNKKYVDDAIAAIPPATGLWETDGANDISAKDNKGVKTYRGYDMDAVRETTVTSLTLVAGGANLGIGQYHYWVTYTTAIGETGIGTFVKTITTDAANRKVTVEIPISTDSRVTGRKIYRSKVGGEAYNVFLLTTVADNTTTTYLDDIADASLGTTQAYWRENTTIKYISYNGTPIMMAGTGAREPGTFLGADAGGTTIAGTADGGSNTGIGAGALRYVTSGNKLVAVGYDAGRNITSGSNSVCLGHLAGRSEFGYGTGSANIYIGRNVALYNRSGSSNVVVGHYAGVGASSYSYAQNTILGAFAGYVLRTGTNNVCAGYQSLYSATTSNHNVCIGYRAGYSLTTNGYCIFIGAEAGRYETGIRKLIIDYISRTNEADQRIKAIIYGEMQSTTATQLLRVNGILEANLDYIRITTAKTPASAAATGTQGDICWDADYIYVCVAANTWKRVAIATW